MISEIKADQGDKILVGFLLLFDIFGDMSLNSRTKLHTGNLDCWRNQDFKIEARKREDTTLPFLRKLEIK